MTSSNGFHANGNGVHVNGNGVDGAPNGHASEPTVLIVGGGPVGCVLAAGSCLRP